MCVPNRSCFLYRRLGRAMLRPIHDQKTRRDGMMSPELARALEWWIVVLESGLCERRDWNSQQGPPVHLFCDASGRPAHLGAVLFDDENCYVTHHAPPTELVDRFRHRRDNQIMGLELLSISLGLCTFAHLVRGRKVIVHSDNTGSEASFECVHVLFCDGCKLAVLVQAAIRRGTAISMDHAQLVHAQWTHVAELGVSLHILRVGTHDNIADLPSRNDMRLLSQLGAFPLMPMLREDCWHQKTWEVLQERWRL